MCVVLVRYCDPDETGSSLRGHDDRREIRRTIEAVVDHADADAGLLQLESIQQDILFENPVVGLVATVMVRVNETGEFLEESPDVEARAVPTKACELLGIALVGQFVDCAAQELA